MKRINSKKLSINLNIKKGSKDSFSKGSIMVYNKETEINTYICLETGIVTITDMYDESEYFEKPRVKNKVNASNVTEVFVNGKKSIQII